MKRKTILTTIVLLVGTPLAAFAEANPKDVASIGTLPGDRKKMELGQLRNPFGFRAKKVSAPTNDDSESQEAKIRRVLGKLEVKGTVGSPESPKVLLGDIILEQGNLVPQLIPGQTEQLLVDVIDSKKIKIVWIETSPDSQTNRSFIIPLNMDVKVEMPLAGNTNGGRGNTILKGKKEIEAERKLTEILLQRMNGSGDFSNNGFGSGASSPSSDGVDGLVRNYDTKAPSGASGGAGPISVPVGAGGGAPSATSGQSRGGSGNR